MTLLEFINSITWGGWLAAHLTCIAYPSATGRCIDVRVGWVDYQGNNPVNKVITLADLESPTQAQFDDALNRVLEAAAEMFGESIGKLALDPRARA